MIFDSEVDRVVAAIACFLCQNGGDPEYMDHGGARPLDVCVAPGLADSIQTHYRR